MMIITNNPLVQEKYSKSYVVYYPDAEYTDILNKARDLVHKGYKLLSHPLSGSIKPKENPYKSLLVSAEPGPGTDYESLVMIENSLILASNFRIKFKHITPEMSGDFKEIDFTLITTALESARSYPACHNLA